MIEIGLYRHYKGDYYFVEGSSTNPDTGEEVVHYRDAAGVWQHRSLVEFTSRAIIDIDENTAQRYTKISSLYHPTEPRFG